MTIRRISSLTQHAKAHLIDAIRDADGTDKDIRRILATIQQPTINKRTRTWAWHFQKGNVQHNPCTESWTVTIEEETWHAKEDLAEISTPTSPR